MSELKKLLEGVKVEWKSLGVIANLITTGRLNANAMDENGTYPFFTCNERPYRINEFAFDLEAILISGNGSKVGHINYYNGKFNAYQRTYVIGELSNDIKMMYLLHYLNFMLKNYIKVNSKKGSVPYITMPMLEQVPIPIPCPDNPEKSLKIQEEIVRILDRLSEETNQLTAALQKELVLHQKRYDFYREALFKFEGKEVEWKKISEIGKFQRGKRFVRTDMISEGVPCIHYGEMYTHYGISAVQSKSYLNREFALAKKLRVADKGDVVIVAAGETVEDIGKGTAWLGDEGVVTHDACFSYKSPLNPTYFAYFTRTSQYHDQIKRNISSGKISAINEKGFSSVIIPVPSPEEQNRIVKILDDLDAKTQAITEAIQKEIVLRNKQYEYYRDRLLSFQSLQTDSEVLQ